eukprot:g5194.t1
MSRSLQHPDLLCRWLVVSLLVLLTVEVASRSGQVQLAAVAAAIPTGLPLALCIVVSKSPRQEELVEFSDAVLRGTASTLAFAVAMALAARRAWGVLGMLLSGYTTWMITWKLLAWAAASAESRKVD